MEANNQNVRQPKQARSIQKKKLIQQTALSLFCSKGFQNVSTNQISKEANLSIGTLYEYYKNKEDILYDILDDYYNEFLNSQNQLLELIRNGIKSVDKRTWLHELLSNLIKSHSDSKEFNYELHSLYFSLPKVAEICNKQKSIIQNIFYISLLDIKNELTVNDVQIAAIVLTDIISSIVDRIVSYQTNFDKECILDEGIDAISMYLFGKKDFCIFEFDKEKKQ